MRVKRNGARAVAVAVVGVLGLLLAGAAHALSPVLIGGTDAQSSYEGYTDAQPNAGVFTFFDAIVEATPQKGFVDTPDPNFLSFVNATVDLDIVFDTSVCNPAACGMTFASFKGANAGADLIFWPEAGGPIPLLALEIDFIDVVQASPASGGNFAMGGQVINENLFGTSKLRIVGGSEAAAIIAFVGGNKAILRMDINKPKDNTGDKIRTADLLSTGIWFNEDWTVGLPAIIPVGATNFDLVIVPEPGTAGLLGLSLVGLALHARRRRSR
jgi:hypothetical protein